MPRGRKPLYDVKSLEIGQKLALLGVGKTYSYQYLRQFNRRGEQKFKRVVEGENLPLRQQKIFVERIA